MRTLGPVRVIPRCSSTPDEALNALLLRYGAAIYAVLKTIRARKITEPDRYLILPLEGSEYYVQCKFFDEDRQIHCEAVSGAFNDWSLTEEQIAVLASLGYDVTKPEQNYAVEHSVTEEAALMYVPVLLIETLYRVFGLTQKTKLRFEAPYVPGFTDLEVFGRRALEPRARR
jgi:hypothetical protein